MVIVRGFAEIDAAGYVPVLIEGVAVFTGYRLGVVIRAAEVNLDAGREQQHRGDGDTEGSHVSPR